MTDDLLKWRGEFPILDHTVYLISHSLGAMPRATHDRLHEYADIWATRGVRAWAGGRYLAARQGTVMTAMPLGTVAARRPCARSLTEA